MEQENLERKELIQRLEANGDHNKLEEESQKWATIATERQKKVDEVMADKENFKSVEVANVVKDIVSKRVETDVKVPIECDVYNILDCSKADLEILNSFLKDKIQKVDDSEENAAGDESKKKSDEAMKKKYL